MTKRNYEEVFQDASALLIKNHAFFGHILANMVRHESKQVKTMAVSMTEKSQIVLEYNTDMIKREVEENGATLKNIAAIIQHEVYHVINEHFIRGHNVKLDRWVMTPLGPMKLFPISCDLAINQFISDLPRWVLGLETFDGIKLPPEEAAEIYYKQLLKIAQSNAKEHQDKLNNLGQASGVLFIKTPKDGNKEQPTGMPNPNNTCPQCGGSGQVQTCPTCGQPMSQHGDQGKQGDKPSQSQKGQQGQQQNNQGGNQQSQQQDSQAGNQQSQQGQQQGSQSQQGPAGNQQSSSAQPQQDSQGSQGKQGTQTCPTCGQAMSGQQNMPGNQGQQGQQSQQGQAGNQQSSGAQQGSQGQAGNASQTQPCPSCNGTGQQPSQQPGQHPGSIGNQVDAINQWLPFDQEALKKLMEKLGRIGKTPTSKQTGMPGGHDSWENSQNIPRELADATIKQAVREAYQKAKFGGQGVGNLPAGIERMCKETLKPAYNFAPFLKRFIDGELFARFRQTRKRPNRRYRWEYPGKKTETKGKIGILVDTSGSIYDEDIALFIKNIQQMSEYAELIVFDVDTAIHDVRKYNKRRFEMAVKGGGGTGFTDVFKVIKDYYAHRDLLAGVPKQRKRMVRQYVSGLKALIIMTDGMVYDIPKQEPNIPVMWALTSRAYKAPREWGKVIYLDNKPEHHNDWRR